MDQLGLAAAVAALAGGALAAGVGFNARAVGERLSLMDYPDPSGGRKLHLTITPLVGGLVVAGAVALGTSLALALGPGPALRSLLLWYAAVVVGLALIGLADDRFGLSPGVRLGLAAALLLLGSADVPDFQIMFMRFADAPRIFPLIGWSGIVFTLICLVGFLNAVNMADGKNGLVIGQALIWSAALAWRLPSPLLPPLAALATALAVLFVFNMRGRLFLGDSGSYGLSAAFGLLAVVAWNNGFADMNAEDVALIFALPVFDTLRLIVMRMARGLSPFTPGRDHLHHYLHARWGWPRPLSWVLLLSACTNLGAILLPGTGFAWLGLAFAGYAGLLFASRGSLRTAL